MKKGQILICLGIVVSIPVAILVGQMLVPSSEINPEQSTVNPESISTSNKVIAKASGQSDKLRDLLLRLNVIDEDMTMEEILNIRQLKLDPILNTKLKIMNDVLKMFWRNAFKRFYGDISLETYVCTRSF